MSSLFKSPKAPAAPDPTNTLNQQAQYSFINQQTPYGNLQYGTTDANGNFVPREGALTQQIQETPFQKQIREGGQGFSLDILSKILQGGVNLPTANDISAGLTPIQDFNTQIDKTRNDTYNASYNLLKPQLEKQKRDLAQQLADQGLPMGSQAYASEMDRLERSQAEQLNNLSLQSTSAGNALQNQLFGQQSQQRQQQLGEQLSLRNLTFSDLASVLGMNPQFQQYNTPTIDAAGIINQGYANQLSRWQGQAQDRQANLAALAALAGQAVQAGKAAASDINLKENIKKVGNENGFNIYEFNYKGKPEKYRGVVAQEVQKTHPEAVTIKDGFLAVFYDMIGIKFEAI